MCEWVRERYMWHCLKSNWHFSKKGNFVPYSPPLDWIVNLQPDSGGKFSLDIWILTKKWKKESIDSNFKLISWDNAPSLFYNTDKYLYYMWVCNHQISVNKTRESIVIEQ